MATYVLVHGGGHGGWCYKALRLENEQALAAIPQFHVVCEQNYQYNKDTELFAQASAAGRLWRIDTGHDLMITEPDAVAGVLMEIAAL